MGHDFLELTQDGYDRTAGDYAERFHHHLDDRPVDLAMVSAFAGLVSMSDDKRVLDVGCGTGAATAVLCRSGVDAFGIDLSPNMIAEAQRLNRDIDFSVGSMGEFYWVLVPGGFVVLAFQVGHEPLVLDQAWASARSGRSSGGSPGMSSPWWSGPGFGPTPKLSASRRRARSNPRSRRISSSESLARRRDDQPSRARSLRYRFIPSIFSTVVAAGPV
jgi:SAM-dependent methyltransferase